MRTHAGRTLDAHRTHANLARPFAEVRDASVSDGTASDAPKVDAPMPVACGAEVNDGDFGATQGELCATGQGCCICGGIFGLCSSL